MSRAPLVGLLALLAAGCRCEPSVGSARTFCETVVVGSSAESARQRAVAQGFDVVDFQDGRGFLAREDSFLPFDVKHCQVNAVDGHVTKTDFFYD